MKKLILKLTGLLLSACLLNASAAFADSEYLTNFSRAKTYSDGQFTDIGDEWYTNSVRTVFETGLMSGNSATTFNPKGNLTNAEAVAVAARLHSIYNTGKDSFSTGSPWYKVYIDYAVSNGICDNNFDAEQTANRAFFAAVLRNAVDEDALPKKNSIADGELYDVNGWYSEAVYSFYRAGVLSGNDQYGTFAPDKPITRAEVAAIVVRVVKPSERVEVKLQERPAEGTYTLPEDDGSLDAYKRRALVANFKVLLDGKEKDSNWENDVYTINHSGTTGVPSETVVIPNRYLDSRYDNIWNDYAVAFKASHVSPELNEEITIPVYRIKSHTPYSINGKSYVPSVINTNGQVDFMGDWLIMGDLQLYYPGVTDVADWSETYTYDSYTSDARYLINSAERNYPTPNAEDIKAFVKQHLPVSLSFVSAFEKDEWYSTDDVYKIRMHYLREWNGKYLFKTLDGSGLTMTPRYELDGNVTVAEQYIDMSGSGFEKWAKNHIGKLIITVTKNGDSSFNGIKPCMMAEVKNYDTSQEGTIKTWHFDGDTLTITRDYPPIEYGDVIIDGKYSDNSAASGTKGSSAAAVSDETDMSGLSEVIITGFDYEGKTVLCGFNKKIYEDKAFLVYEDEEKNTYKFQKSADSNSPSITLTLNSTKAAYWDGKKEQTINIKAPKIINETLYFPADEIIPRLFD